MIGAGFAEWEAAETGRRTSDAMQHRKKRGFAYNQPTMGFRNVPLRTLPGESRPYKVRRPRDAATHEALAELARRVDSGERFSSIARDWYKRDMRCGNKRWVYFNKKRQPEIHNLQRAYKAWKVYVANTLPSGDASSAACPSGAITPSDAGQSEQQTPPTCPSV